VFADMRGGCNNRNGCGFASTSRRQVAAWVPPYSGSGRVLHTGPFHCHSERSEESRYRAAETLRCAQGDMCGACLATLEKPRAARGPLVKRRQEWYNCPQSEPSPILPETADGNSDMDGRKPYVQIAC